MAEGLAVRQAPFDCDQRRARDACRLHESLRNISKSDKLDDLNQ